MLSDVKRFVQSQIDGVIFTRDYFDFNVMAVVAMACCEMFFTDELSLVKCSFVRSCRNRVVLPIEYSPQALHVS